MTILGHLGNLAFLAQYDSFTLSALLFQHIGPAIPEVSSVWFKLYIYHVTGQGPPSLLLSKGTRLRKLPDIFQVCCVRFVCFNYFWGRY